MTTDPHQPQHPVGHAATPPVAGRQPAAVPEPAGATGPDTIADPGTPVASGKDKGRRKGGARNADPAAKPPPENAVKFTRAAALWSSLIVGFLILIVLLTFVAQNTESATFHFLGWSWSQPLGVAILLAAVSGGLLTVFVGAARIVQLRRAAKKNFKAALR